MTKSYLVRYTYNNGSTEKILNNFSEYNEAKLFVNTYINDKVISHINNDYNGRIAVSTNIDNIINHVYYSKYTIYKETNDTLEKRYEKYVYTSCDKDKLYKEQFNLNCSHLVDLYTDDDLNNVYMNNKNKKVYTYLEDKYMWIEGLQ